MGPKVGLEWGTRQALYFDAQVECWPFEPPVRGKEAMSCLLWLYGLCELYQLYGLYGAIWATCRWAEADISSAVCVCVRE